MKLRTILISLATPLLTPVFVACDDDDKTPATTTTADTSTVEETSSPSDTSQVEETTPVEETSVAETSPAEVVIPTECAHDPACQDDQISQLSFRTSVNARLIEEETAPAGQFLSHVDGTAGGFGGDDGYLYAKFTDAGLEAVRISDEDSLEDATWDIAFRRFVVRLNSGVSGPSCVLGATLNEGTEFGGVSAAPDVSYSAEAYFEGAGCNYVDDGSGIGAPGTVLSSYWEYPTGCVKMTGRVFVLRLADGHHVKLQVESYYDADIQAECDEGEDITGRTSSAGNFRVRWAYLD